MGATASSQEQCTTIANDIERLACYDGIFSEEREPSNPLDAFERFKDIVTYDGENDILYVKNYDCTLAVTRVSGIKYDNYSKKTFFKAAGAIVPLKAVDVEKTRNSRRGLGFGKEAILLRGNEGKFWGDVLNGTPKTQTIKGNIRADMNTWRVLIESSTHEQGKSTREVPLPIFHGTYKSDRDEIWQAFMEYAEACSS